MVLSTWVDIDASFAALTEAKSVEASLPAGSATGAATKHEARLHWNAAQLDRAGECAREAIARFRAVGDLWGESDLWEPVVVALHTGRPAEAQGLIHDLERRAERVGNHGTIWLCRNFSAEMHLAMGALERAEQAAHESHELGRSTSTRWLYLDMIVLGALSHYRGRFEEAAAWFRQGLELQPPAHWRGFLVGGLFRALAAKGDPAAAEALAEAHRLLPVPGRLLTLGACGCLASTIEGLAWLGRDQEAAALEPHAEHVAANGPLCTYGQHLFRTSAGIAAACAHHWSRAEEHHRTAIEQADTAPYRVTQPVARYWYAEMLLGRGAAGDEARARDLMTEAFARFGSLGMPGYGRRASERLASLGI